MFVYRAVGQGLAGLQVVLATPAKLGGLVGNARGVQHLQGLDDYLGSGAVARYHRDVVHGSRSLAIPLARLAAAPG